MSTDIHSPDAQGFIQGVFNYCDRRCERCRFVRQCRVGAVDVDDVGEAEDAIANERPEDLRARLMKLMGLPPEDPSEDDAGDDELDEGKEERPEPRYDTIDLEPTPEERRKEEAMGQRIHDHPLTNMGITYMDMVDEWLEPREAALTANGVVLHRQQELSLAVSLRTPEKLLLGEAFDEILWFKLMVHVKTQRALRGKFEGPEWMGELDLDPEQSDWNGTAKLCLEIVQRSNAAWGTVAELMPEEADGIIPLQELLRRVAEELHKEFPDAGKFIRPGFDGPGSQL